MDNKHEAKENILKESKEIDGISIKGYDFNLGVDYEKILDSFASTGFQATHFDRAVKIIEKMIETKSHIFLSYTSNMVSSGLRDVFRYLVEHKKVNVCVTSGGGVEEDFIKCLGDFKLGSFNLSGEKLREDAINRIGNVLVPNSRYIAFEEFVIPILKELYDEKKRPLLPSEIIWKLGEKIDNKESIYYWAWKNKIKVYCPTIMDGSLGDMIYFLKYQKGYGDFAIDIAEDTKNLNDSTIGLEKSGVIILGAGVIKHSVLNANLYRNGADYAVYINTASEYDGSDAGATPEEAVSWGKILPEAKRVKVYGDATILFPLIVAKTFAKNNL